MRLPGQTLALAAAAIEEPLPVGAAQSVAADQVESRFSPPKAGPRVG